MNDVVLEKTDLINERLPAEQNGWWLTFRFAGSLFWL